MSLGCTGRHPKSSRVRAFDLGITVRFDEKEGLLDGRHVRREGNNYRNYSDEAIERLKLEEDLI